MQRLDDQMDALEAKMPERIGAWRMHVKRRVVGELQSSPIDPGARKLTAQQAMAKAGPSYAQANGNSTPPVARLLEKTFLSR